MQVHDRPHGTPVLALAGGFTVCKTHAKPYTLCIHSFFTENGGIFKRATAWPVLQGGGCDSGSVHV